jgi:peptidase E
MGKYSSLGRDLEWVNPRQVFKVMTASWRNKDKLVTQIQAADIIVAHGGNGDVLQSYFENIPLADLVAEDKVCAGGSAGANMWATNYYSNDNQAVMDGLGCAPINTFCHYNSYKWRSLNELRDCNDLPIVPLMDDDFVVYQKPD